MIRSLVESSCVEKNGFARRLISYAYGYSGNYLKSISIHTHTLNSKRNNKDKVLMVMYAVADFYEQIEVFLQLLTIFLISQSYFFRRIHLS